MFTRMELNVLQAALSNFKGYYGEDQMPDLTKWEKEVHEKSIKTAENLRDRFEEILYNYYEMENKFSNPLD